MTPSVLEQSQTQYSSIRVPIPTFGIHSSPSGQGTTIETSFSYAEKPDGTTVRLKKGHKPENDWRLFQSVTLRSPHPGQTSTMSSRAFRRTRMDGRLIENGWKNTTERTGSFFPNRNPGRYGSRCIWTNRRAFRCKTSGPIWESVEAKRLHELGLPHAKTRSPARTNYFSKPPPTKAISSPISSAAQAPRQRWRRSWGGSGLSATWASSPSTPRGSG